MTKDSTTKQPATQDTEKRTKTSSWPSPLALLSLVVVGVAVSGGFCMQYHAKDGNGLLPALQSGKELSQLHPRILSDDSKLNVAKIETRHLLSDLSCKDAEFKAAPLLDGKLFPVTQPMEAAERMASDRVFFLLNGRNDGVYVSWNGQFDCVGQAAEVAAVWLGADRDVLANGVRLYSQMGWPVRNAAELAASKNIVHILLDFQLWQWPGIKKGYKYVLEDGVTLTMVGVSPKVFDVEYFLSQEEADKIIELGSPSLDRSRIGEFKKSEWRTSHTAFLNDSAFTRDFRVRSARVARLPSASYPERLQLVRYGAGEFYRKHHDTQSEHGLLAKSSEVHPLGMEAFNQWATWAAQRLRDLRERNRDIPEAFLEGGELFPNPESHSRFPNALLRLFYPVANASNLFRARSDESWLSWIAENVDINATGILPRFIGADAKPAYLPLIVKAWEDALGLPELHYTFPKPAVNAFSHFFAWVRWVKERIDFLDEAVPMVARPTGELYPTYTDAFQKKLVDFILDDYSEGYISRLSTADWYAWMVTNRGRDNVLFKMLKNFPQLAELAIKTWEARVGAPTQLRYKLPEYVKPFHPQRFVTLFLYLNNQTKVGGETVFPYSVDRFSDEGIVRDGMDECSSGLAVPPLGLHASLFYVQTPEGDVDLMSLHGGCPPHEGVKWGSNSFMWDSDAYEGDSFWKTATKAG